MCLNYLCGIQTGNFLGKYTKYILWGFECGAGQTQGIGWEEEYKAGWTRTRVLEAEVEQIIQLPSLYAGRAAHGHVWPLRQGEILHWQPHLITFVFSQTVSPVHGLVWQVTIWIILKNFQWRYIDSWKLYSGESIVWNGGGLAMSSNTTQKCQSFVFQSSLAMGWDKGLEASVGTSRYLSLSVPYACSGLFFKNRRWTVRTVSFTFFPPCFINF